MRRFFVFLAAIFVCFSLVSCGDKSTLSQFEQLLKEGNYTAAMEIYSEKAHDNSDRRNAMIGILKNVAEQSIADYLSDAIAYENAQMQIDAVKRMARDGNMLDEDTLAGYDQRLSDANASKVAYDSGKNLLQSKNYRGAIEQFEKVASNDCHFADAQTQIEAAMQAYKSEAVEKAKQSADAGKFDEADAAITEAVALFPDDTELLTLQATYGKSYVSQVISAAEAVLVNPGTDYEKAIELLRPAMQKYPDDAALKEKYDYFMEFAPVSLFAINSYTSTVSCSEDVTDNTGHVYKEAKVVGWMFRFDASFDIEGKFNVLHGFAAVPEESKGSSPNGYIEIYGDGKLLWENHSINGNIKPQEITIDISGVKDLRVVMSGGLLGFLTTEVMFADVTLQKTVK